MSDDLRERIAQVLHDELCVECGLELDPDGDDMGVFSLADAVLAVLDKEEPERCPNPKCVEGVIPSMHRGSEFGEPCPDPWHGGTDDQ